MQRREIVLTSHRMPYQVFKTASSPNHHPITATILFMKCNQNGFSAVEVVIVVLAVGLLGFGGWYVLYKNKSKETTGTSMSVTQKDATAEAKVEESYDIPVGYTLYENKEIGFKFVYPEEWGKLTTKNSSGRALDLEGALIPTSDPRYPTSLIVFSDKKSTFKMMGRYRAPVLSPSLEANKIVWKVAESSEYFGITAGEVYERQPQVVRDSKGVTVYDFPAGHASAEWTSWAFAVGDYFVGIGLPQFNSMDYLEESQTALDTAESKRSQRENIVLESIRVLER